MSRSRSHHPAFVFVALLALGLVLGTSLLVSTDFHDLRVDCRAAVKLTASGAHAEADGLPCNACLLRAQLEGSDLVPLRFDRVATAAGDPLRLPGPPVVATATDWTLPPRGPPAPPSICS